MKELRNLRKGHADQDFIAATASVYNSLSSRMSTDVATSVSSKHPA